MKSPNGVKPLVLIAIFLFCSLICAEGDEGNIKYPNVSGQFYSSDKSYLDAQIDNFFKNVKEDPSLKDKDILGIIVPHAGYIYSGQVAAYAFKALEARKFDAVIILAPTHFYEFRGISVYKEGFFNTPLGNIAIDKELAQRFISYDKKISFIPHVFQREHSLEVELPFLQKSLNDLKIVPIILGQLEFSDCVMLARAIADVTKDKKVLVVASTDLSHYHPYLEALPKDKKTISYFKELDAFGLWQSLLKNESELCGYFPVFVLLNYAKAQGFKAELLNYANSGDSTGDKSTVVGYSSVIFYKNYDKNSLSESKSNFSTTAGSRLPQQRDTDAIGKKQEKGEEEMFSDIQKKRLLEIVRQTVSEYVTKRKVSDFKEDDPQLNIKRGAFVTLRKNGDLRGCIGSFTSNEPLYKVISQMAIESATGDPRFSPVTKEELGQIKIEISVLTEPKLTDDWRKIRLGIDGVIIRRGFSSGVFLPQVATETGWGLETFLKELCQQKAGLPADCYKDSKTQIYTFQAIIFEEE